MGAYSQQWGFGIIFDMIDIGFLLSFYAKEYGSMGHLLSLREENRNLERALIRTSVLWS